MLQLNTFELEKLEEATGISEKNSSSGKNTGPVDSTVMRKLMVKANPPHTPC